MKLIISTLLLIFMITCGGNGSSPHSPSSTVYMTNQGYILNIPNSVFEHGLYLPDHTITDKYEIEVILKSWLDIRVNEWAQGDSYRINVARSINFILFDDWHYRHDGGYCVGDYFEDHTVYASIYSKFESSNMPTYNYPPHTLVQHIDDDGDKTLKWYAGQIIDGVGLEVIPHELNHAIGINH